MLENNPPKLNQFKLIGLTCVFMIMQLIINTSSTVYVDILGVLLMILLVNQLYSLQQLIIIAYVADLIGHWYLGSHLFSLILLSFLTDKNFNFYKMSNYWQKNLFIIIFYALFNLVMAIIGVLTHSLKIDLLDFACEAFILCPVIFLIVSRVLATTSVDLFY